MAAGGHKTAGELVSMICQGQNNVTLYQVKEMSRALLCRALAEYRLFDPRTNRTQTLVDEQEETLLEEMQGYVLQWFGAHKTLRRLLSCMSNSHYHKVKSGQEKAYER